VILWRSSNLLMWYDDTRALYPLVGLHPATDMATYDCDAIRCDRFWCTANRWKCHDSNRLYTQICWTECTNYQSQNCQTVELLEFRAQKIGKFRDCCVCVRRCDCTALTFSVVTCAVILYAFVTALCYLSESSGAYCIGSSKDGEIVSGLIVRKDFNYHFWRPMI